LVEPKKNNINIIKLDAFLQDAKLRKKQKVHIKNLEDGDLYIVTEIIKAKEFTVEVEAELDSEAKLNAPIKNVVEAGGNVVLEKSKKSCPI
jgi:hypothetical protein